METTQITNQRVVLVDALRGFALFGIFVVNSAMMASPYQALGLMDPSFTDPLSRTVRWVCAFLFEAKFYLLFAFLYGYSFTLQVDAAARRGAAFRPAFLRRLLGLVLLGITHAVLFYPGDILLPYAVLSVLLLRWQGLSSAQALRRAGWLALTTCVVWLGFCALMWQAGPMDPRTLDSAEKVNAHAAALMYSSGWVATVVQNAQAWSRDVAWQALLVQGPWVLLMFLLGMVAGRRTGLDSAQDSAARLNRLAGMGLLPACVGAAIYASTSESSADLRWQLLGYVIGLLSAPALSLVYGVAFLRLWQSRWGERLAAWLAPAGRMALSNYLLQSVACAFVFTGWGLGWVAAVPPALVLALVLVFFGLQMCVSRWWLQRYDYGPVEGLLRGLTWAQWPRWRGRPGD